MLQELSPAQRALADYMSELSELAHCAGWLHHLEFRLWRLMQSEEQGLGRLSPSSTQLATLRELSMACGGWIAFDDTREEVWLPLAVWRTRYESWLRMSRVESRAHRVLCRLEAFVAVDRSVLGTAVPGIEPGESPIGWYRAETGSEGGAFSLSTVAVYVPEGGGHRRVPLGEITGASVPGSKATASSVALTLKDGSTVAIHVAGGQGRFRDAFEVQRFFMRIAVDVAIE